MQKKEFRMNLVKNNFILVILFLFLYNCSFDNKTGLWKNEKSIIENQNIKIIFKDEEKLIKEINSDLKIKISSKSLNKSFANNLNNNNGRLNYNGNLKSLSKYKFSDIKNFDKAESEIIVHNESVIFLAEGKNNIALIENRHIDNFLSSASNLNIKLNKINEIEGFNYSKGQKIKISFFKVAK